MAEIPGLAVALVSFCEKIAGAVTTTGNQNGWRVQQFGRRGFNADVVVGGANLKIMTGGAPAPDGSGATIRLRRPGHDATFTVRLAKDGELELTDEAGGVVDLQELVARVAIACDAPLKTVVEVPPPLARLFEQLGNTVIGAGNDNGWAVTPFGSKGFNADVAIGSTVLKLTTEIKSAGDGSGSTLRMKRGGDYEKTLTARTGAEGGLELTDEKNQAVTNARLIDLIAEGCGLSINVDTEIPATLNRLYEKIATTVVKAGQDNGWKVQRFGARGFNCDVAIGPNIVKLTTDAKSATDGSGATVWFKRAGLEMAFTSKVARDGELELVDKANAAVDLHRFIELLAEACGAPLKAEADVPLPLVRFCEKVANTLVNAGNDNGWKVKLFGSKGVNSDVAVGPNVAKVTTQGTPGTDGGGVVIRVAGPGGFERSFPVRARKDGELELTDKDAPVAFERFLEIVGEACGAPISAAAEVPAALHRLLENVKNTVGNAGVDNGWRVVAFGAYGFNADLTVGNNVMKITTEGKPGPDGAGAVLRLKRPGLDRSFTSRVMPAGELELSDEKGPIPMDRLVEILKEASKF